MAAPDHLGRQFSTPPGDEDARKKLLKQLKPDFPKQALEWLQDPSVRVDAPARIDPEQIDWDDYPDWRASHELKKVQKIAKKLDKKKGKAKPSVLTSAPGQEDNLFLADGHHHALARVDRNEKVKAFVVHVPRQHGPWEQMHDEQLGDTDKPDFKGEQDRDRR